MKRVVALKVLSPRLNARPDLVQRFQREVQAAAKLLHPNIVRALDAEIAGTRRFLVMEYVTGSDLSQLVKQRGRMSVALALDCVLQAARGLDYAHRQGIVQTLEPVAHGRSEGTRCKRGAVTNGRCRELSSGHQDSGFGVGPDDGRHRRRRIDFNGRDHGNHRLHGPRAGRRHEARRRARRHLFAGRHAVVPADGPCRLRGRDPDGKAAGAS